MTAIMKNLIIMMLATVCVLGVTGCNSVIGITPSTTPITANDTYTKLGYTSGGAVTTSILGLITFGSQNPAKTARDAAIANKGGNALIEVTEEYNVFNFIGIFQIFTTCVEGTAIKFERRGVDVQQ
jgi:hypothetical protein